MEKQKVSNALNIGKICSSVINTNELCQSKI